MSTGYFKKIAKDELQPKKFSFDKENLVRAKRNLKNVS